MNIFIIKTIKIRSYEMGLYFRDGEFKGLLSAGRYWLFDPLWNPSSPTRQRNNVDLPAPLWPRIDAVSPTWTSKLTPSRTGPLP